MSSTSDKQATIFRYLAIGGAVLVGAGLLRLVLQRAGCCCGKDCKCPVCVCSRKCCKGASESKCSCPPGQCKCTAESNCGCKAASTSCCSSK